MTTLCFALLLASQDPALPTTLSQDGEVEVTSSRLQEPLKESAAALTVVDGQRIEAEHVTTPTDLLRGLPGMHIVRTGSGRGGVTSMFTRGTNSNHTLLLVDGFKFTRDGGRFFEYDLLTPDALDRIEAVRGAGSAVHGSDAIAGTINLISRRGRGPGEVRLGFEAGTFTTVRGYAEIAGGTDDYGYAVAASRYEQSDGTYPHSDFEDVGAAARFDVKIAEHTHLKIVTRYAQAELEVPTNGPPRFTPLDPNATREDELLLVGAELVQRLAPGLHATLRISRFQADQVSEDPIDPSDFGTVMLDSFFARTGGELQIDGDLGAYGVLSFGGVHEREEIESVSFFDFGGPFTVTADQERNNSAVFAQWSLEIGDLHVVPGVRYEDNEAFGGDLNARVAAAYLFKGSGTKLRGTLGSGITAPQLDQNYGANGNPDLEPEQSVMWDVGIDQWLFEDRIRVGVTYFEGTLEDIIQFQSSPNPPFGQYVNGGDGVVRGIEAEGEWRPSGMVVVGASYTYLKTRTTELDQPGGATLIEGEPFIRRPVHSGRVYAGVSRPKEFGAFVDVLLVGDRDDASFQFARPPRETAEKFSRVDVTFWVALVDALRFQVRVENLFDSEYEEIVGFPGQEANFLAGLEYAIRR